MLPEETDEPLVFKERRQSDRRKLIVSVNYEGSDTTGIASTREIGIGGLYLVTNAPLETGTPLFMRMTIGGEEVGLNGMVIYTNPGHGVGIRFQTISEKNEALLKRELNLE
ncbi:MAG: hypothetical protein AVDCRST_MAG74-3332 [uncultured Pyrinomonadaceae bacterium]|uniref:PilZ domain-containing protein n=1 Tax=uncultured Pyrinomonadaceae bacterium TaxID=2283094 RepID=A0A6J4PSG0_9BACT|nr:MAG: hypothetical protein AVDCRST_MAG74-3332 [uncultured Pyrinomonadaceae bacterium]